MNRYVKAVTRRRYKIYSIIITLPVLSTLTIIAKLKAESSEASDESFLGLWLELVSYGCHDQVPQVGWLRTT